MSHLPEGASFEELVQDYFLAFAGAGLMLSPLDGELCLGVGAGGRAVRGGGAGHPARGGGALWDARPGEPALRSLRACRREVEAEIRSTWPGRGPGEARRRPEAPGALTGEDAHTRLRAWRWKRGARGDRRSGRCPAVVWPPGSVLASAGRRARASREEKAWSLWAGAALPRSGWRCCERRGPAAAADDCRARGGCAALPVWRRRRRLGLSESLRHRGSQELLVRGLDGGAALLWMGRWLPKATAEACAPLCGG